MSGQWKALLSVSYLVPPFQAAVLALLLAGERVVTRREFLRTIPPSAHRDTETQRHWDTETREMFWSLSANAAMIHLTLILCISSSKTTFILGIQVRIRREEWNGVCLNWSQLVNFEFECTSQGFFVASFGVTLQEEDEILLSKC